MKGPLKPTRAVNKRCPCGVA